MKFSHFENLYVKEANFWSCKQLLPVAFVALFILRFNLGLKLQQKKLSITGKSAFTASRARFYRLLGVYIFWGRINSPISGADERVRDGSWTRSSALMNTFVRTQFDVANFWVIFFTVFDPLFWDKSTCPDLGILFSKWEWGKGGLQTFWICYPTLSLNDDRAR